MHVLVGSIPFPQNRFFVDLNGALSALCTVEQSSDAFWSMDGDYDVVHLHFPEYLTYDLARAYQDGLTDELIAQVGHRLKYWSGRAPIVVTRHVLLPHDARHDPKWEELYALFYSYADAVVHFAQASIDEFRERYTSLEFNRGREPVHRIIPHANYTSLPNTMSQAEARKALGIPAGDKVMLVFGAIRNDDERELIENAFEGIGTKRKALLVSRWRERPVRISWIRAQNWVKAARRLYYRLQPGYFLNYDFVAEEATQIYLNAADVLFIPRLWVLNSGNVTLGMTFGRVVVGPNSWDVGEILSENGNPVFDPDNPSTASSAIEEGFRLADEGAIPLSNRRKALSEWMPAQCAERYMDLFNHLTKSK